MSRALTMLMMTAGCASASRSPEPIDARRATFLADSIKAAACQSTLSSARIVNSSTSTDAFVRVHVSYHDGDTVSGAMLSSKKPRLSVASGSDGIIRVSIPADSIPRAHIQPIDVRLIGFKIATGNIEIFRGDTIEVEVQFCPQPIYIREH
jgi:hypothetical protein